MSRGVPENNKHFLRAFGEPFFLFVAGEAHAVLRSLSVTQIKTSLRFCSIISIISSVFVLKEFVAVRVQDPRIQNEGSWNSYVDYKIFLHVSINTDELPFRDEKAVICGTL